MNDWNILIQDFIEVLNSLYDLNMVSIRLIDAYLYVFAYFNFSINACGIFLFLL